MFVQNIDFRSAIRLYFYIDIVYLHYQGSILVIGFNLLDLLQMSNCLTEERIVRACWAVRWLFSGSFDVALLFVIVWFSQFRFMLLAFLAVPGCISSTHCCKVVESLAFWTFLPVCRTVFPFWMSAYLSTVSTGWLLLVTWSAPGRLPFSGSSTQLLYIFGNFHAAYLRWSVLHLGSFGEKLCQIPFLVDGFLN